MVYDEQNPVQMDFGKIGKQDAFDKRLEIITFSLYLYIYIYILIYLFIYLFIDLYMLIYMYIYWQI